MGKKPSLVAVFVFTGVAQLMAHHGGDKATIPHAFVHLAVADASGKVARWRLEMAAPRTLTRQGWTRASMTEGEQISVTAIPARDGSATAYVRAGTLANGKKMVDTSTFVRDGRVITFSRDGKGITLARPTK